MRTNLKLFVKKIKQSKVKFKNYHRWIQLVIKN